MCIVSIIIPTYNHSDLILDTLKSAFAQTFNDYEVIVINDGSPDDTAHVLSPLSKAGKIHYFEQENQGQSATRNRGLREARGEFVAFLDDDDLWPVDKLEWQVAYLRDNPDVGVVGGGTEFIDEQGELTGQGYTHEIPVTFNSLFSGNPFVSPGQTLIRGSCLNQVGGLDENLWGADDFDLWFRLSKCCEIKVLPHISLYYRVHSSNASKDTDRMFYNSLNLIKRHLLYVPISERSQPSKDAYRWLSGYIGRDTVWNLKERRNTVTRLKSIKMLSHFIGPSMKDHTLCRKLLGQLCRDILPYSLISKLRAWRKR